jgi:hypothetical protein
MLSERLNQIFFGPLALDSSDKRSIPAVLLARGSLLYKDNE